jgi:hypothetical protein
MDAVNEIFKKRGLSEDQLMKVLLTQEGKDFLKNASLSPQSTETLESLIKVENPAQFNMPAFSVLAAPSAPAPQEPAMEEMQWELPPDISGISQPAEPAMQEQQWDLPPELR